MKYRVLACSVVLAFLWVPLAAPLPGRADHLHGHALHQHHEPLMDWNLTLLCARIYLGALPQAMPGSENDTPERIALGKRLFFEKGISHNKTMACEDCHLLTKGPRAGADVTPTSEGALGVFGKRNAPTVINAGFQAAQFWDGRAPNLREQAKGPILNQIEMAVLHPEEVIEKLRHEPGYAEAFSRAFPGQAEPMTYDNLGEAIAAFERTLIAPGRFDRLLAGDDQAMNAQEKRGLTKFIQYHCVECHSGNSVGGQLFKIIGQKHPFQTEDLGLFAVTKKLEDRYVFKVPMLRNITRTAPYFNAGQIFTLEEAVSLMAWHQLDMLLTNEDRADLIAFLHTLDGDLPPVENPGNHPPVEKPKTP